MLMIEKIKNIIGVVLAVLLLPLVLTLAVVTTSATLGILAQQYYYKSFRSWLRRQYFKVVGFRY